MLKIIGLITLFVILAQFPNQVKAGVDVASYVCKVFWIMGEGTGHLVMKVYNRDVAPQVEAAKKVDLSIPNHN